MLADSDLEIRLQAALCLQRLEVPDPAIAPIFVEALDASTSNSLIGIAIWLSKLEPARTPAIVKRLNEMLAGDDHRAR